MKDEINFAVFKKQTFQVRRKIVDAFFKKETKKGDDEFLTKIGMTNIDLHGFICFFTKYKFNPLSIWDPDTEPISEMILRICSYCKNLMYCSFSFLILAEYILSKGKTFEPLAHTLLFKMATLSHSPEQRNKIMDYLEEYLHHIHDVPRLIAYTDLDYAKNYYSIKGYFSEYATKQISMKNGQIFIF
jgi:hypothetical protein